MSFIIAPSSQKEYDLVDSKAQGVTIENPASYNNHFSNPIRIKKNSEVALLSAKINRIDAFDVQDNNGYYLYTGDELGSSQDVSLRDRVNMPVPYTLTRSQEARTVPESIEVLDNVGRQTMTPSDLLKALDLNQRAIFHPEFRTKGSVEFEIDTSVASKNRTFNGFKFKFDQFNNGSGTTDTSASFLPAHPDSELYTTDANASTYSSTTNTSGSNFPVITRLSEDDADYECVAIAPDFPLALSEGSATFHIGVNASDGGFQVGLTRPKELFNQAPNTYKRNRSVQSLGQEPSYFKNAGNFFFDYVVYVEEATNEIRVYQSAVKSNEFTQCEIEYWNSTAANTDFSGATFTTWNNASYTDIKFTAIGERMLIEIYDKTAVTGGWKKLADSSDPSKWPHTTKRIGQSFNYLYPIVDISVQNASIGLVQYNGRKTFEGTSNIANFVLAYGASNFYGACCAGKLLGDYGVEAIETLDFRRVYKTSHTVSSNASLTGLNASGGVAYSNVFILEHSPMNRASRYMDRSENPFAKVFGANCNEYLGFAPLTEIPRSRNGNDTDATGSSHYHMTSISVPTPYSRHNTFIRINDLPITTFNGAQSGISKIIGTIPRYDNTNQEVGSLNFDITNPVYLDLNNTEDILLNQLKIDFVNIDEKIVTDLTGTTVVTLHIREKASL